MGSLFTIAGIIVLLFSRYMRKFRMLGFLALFVIIGLMALKAKSYYTLGVFPLLIAAGSVVYEKWFRLKWLRVSFPVILVLLTLPVLPIGIPVYKMPRLIEYFDYQEKTMGIDIGRRFEDGTIHSLPQDYADMIGWEELTAITAEAYNRVKDKSSCIIYGENYGEASAISVIGKRYGLPEAISFSESFKYWLPEKFEPDITSVIYINDNAPGEDVISLFSKVTKTGSISNPHAREFGTSVWLLEEPVRSFNSFWAERITDVN